MSTKPETPNGNPIITDSPLLEPTSDSFPQWHGEILEKRKAANPPDSDTLIDWEVAKVRLRDRLKQKLNKLPYDQSL